MADKESGYREGPTCGLCGMNGGADRFQEDCRQEPRLLQHLPSGVRRHLIEQATPMTL